MDAPVEKESSKPEIVTINQDFQIFDPRRTVQTRVSGILRKPGHLSMVTLNIPGLPLTPFKFTANNYGIEKAYCVTPFDRDIGYPIDQDDLDPQSRIDKYKRLGKSLFKNLSMTSQNANLDVYSYSNDMRLEDEPSILRHPSLSRFNALQTNILQNLRLQLFFPEGSFESRLKVKEPESGDLYFGLFYPVDTGPLQVPDNYKVDIDGSEIVITDGYLLHVPSEDIDLLQQIKGRFLLEENHKEVTKEPSLPAEISEYIPPLGVKRK